MIKKQYFVVFIFLCACYFGFGQTTDLIISEYGEGSKNNKYIEIYNGTGTSVDLVDYSVELYSNGNSTPNSTQNFTSGTIIANGDVYVLYNSSADATIVSQGDQASAPPNFNGDDAIALLKLGTVIDVVGEIGTDPGSGWDVAGITDGTLDHTLVRKSTVCSPNTNWTSSAGTNASDSEWIVYAQDEWSYLGSHSDTCSITNEVDWCDLQSPATGTITYGGVYNVYAQAYEPGVTDSAGQGSGISAWIGYSTSNTDPSTWTDWVVASYNTDVGNNDEYVADIGSVIPASGTYYYASRFQYNGGPYSYGGITPPNGGDFWDGSTYISGVLTVNPDQVDFCNVDYPKTAGITTGSTFNVYAQAYEPGVTDSAGQGSGIQAWIGYNTISEDYEPWNSSGWTWIAATYDSDWLNNDQYVAEIGCGLPAGIYYYASRFQLNGSDYSYGGIRADNVGNFWDYAPNDNNGTLTITDPPLADVVITEIMYNTSGTDDEWIEICNESGSAQDLSNYTIEVTGGNADGTVFTFPCNTSIANGDCITLDLGDGGGSEYNFDCPFTTDYSNGFGTGTLGNTSGTITLKATNGTTADSVAYDDGDGGDGNGSSLHVIDTSLDNSDTGYNWQEVGYGGSSGTNSLVPNCAPMVAEINVEGNLGSYPDITDGDITPSGTDNTLFAAQYIGASQAKSYRIQNLGGLDLTIFSVTLTGDIGDFTITGNPSTPIIYGTPSILEITFSPTATGTRTAVVHIFNNDDNTDGDTEDEYTFTIQGDGLCVAGSDTIIPSSGPVGTIVKVIGSNLNTASASFNGVSATVNHVSDSMMEVVVPIGAVTGNLEIVDDLPCTTIIPFNVIDNQIGSCEGGSPLSELFISEVTDATYGGLTYVELYNATGSAINLSTYSIDIYINGNTDPLDTNLYHTQALSGTINPNQTFVISTGYSGSFNCDSQPGGDASYSDFDSPTLGGINKKDNGHDFIGLYESGTLIDAFGVFGDDDWMDTLHTTVTGDRGFDFRRLNTAALPQTSFDDNDWIIIDWPGSGSGSCSTNDYSDIGVYDFSTGTPPLVDSGPTISSSCNTATISVTASEGYSGGNTLTYQWYYLAPGDSGWTQVPDDATYDNVTSGTLDILNTSLLEDYQYYCQIREDDSSCYSASDAVQLTLPKTTWTSGGWSDGLPDSDTIVIIDYDYDTASDGNFSSCSLIVNAGATLDIKDNTYIQVENDAVIDGSIIVRTHGAFVQVSDSGSFTLNPGGSSEVEKYTANLDAWYEYTYWSSPVIGETVEDAFPDTPSTRRFWFNAQNYKDSMEENGNSGTYSSGQDDIDDNGDDWQIASGVMIAGLGYAATSSPLGMFPRNDQAVFTGEFHTGDISIPIYRNDSELADNNWNFIGNPYPCAISADSLLLNNLAIEQNVPYKPVKSGFTYGAIFLWSQDSPPLSGNSGNEKKNFSQNDYAIITMTAVVAGGDGVTPSRFIPSGQGFFIAMDDSAIPDSVNGNIATGTVIFTNSMRMADTSSNSLFFRTSGSSKSGNLPNKLWVNLTTDNGVFNQIAVGYINGATKDYDGMAYDTPRNLSNPLYSSIYTMINGVDKKFAIQGKAPKDLNLGEKIQLGFDTSIDVSTLYTLSIDKVEGDFLSSNPIYLKDNFMNIVHNLSESDYSFTSEVGEFKNRFELVFRSEALSDTEAQLNSKNLSIIELNDGRVQFKTNNHLTIKSVKIMDVLGRMLYQLKGSSSSEIYDLSHLSQSAYIAKVELSNGQVITKRAIKRL